MRIRIAVPDEHVGADVIDPVLEAVTRLNDHMIQTGQTPTSHELIARGAIWRPENMADEHFDHGGTIASRGWGDCDDWAPLHAATLRASGEDPGARATVIPSGPNTFHAIVKRSNGTIEDPSIAAGMKSERPSNISGDESIETWARDPHDGRIYQGALLPTVGVMSLHCGPGVAVRGCQVIGGGPLYEARVDTPILGSCLVGVRAKRHRHGRKCVGIAGMPFSVSTTHMARTRDEALNGALVGAILTADAGGLATPLDRYKLLALQSANAGLSPGQVREGLIAHIHADMHAASQATGAPVEHHVKELFDHTFPQGITGYSQFPGSQALVGGLFSAIGHIASSIVSDVGKVVSTVAKAAGPWVGTIIHGIQAAVSVIPGLGTAVSDVIAAAETAYEAAVALAHGNVFEAAIHGAYNFATGTIPGASALRPILDPVVNALIGLTVKKEPIEAAVLDGLLSQVPDSPKIGPLSPRSIAASIGHLIVSHLGVKQSKGSPPPKSVAAKPMPAAVHPLLNIPLHAPVVVKAKAPAKPMLVRPAPLRLPAGSARPKPMGFAHAATHARSGQTINPMVQHV